MQISGDKINEEKNAKRETTGDVCWSLYHLNNTHYNSHVPSFFASRDLSNNNLTSVPDHAFAAYPSLQYV